MRAEQYAKLTKEQRKKVQDTNSKSRKKCRRQFNFELGNNSDAEVIAWLDGQVNKADAMRRAVREYMQNHPDDRPGRTPLDKGWDK